MKQRIILIFVLLTVTCCTACPLFFPTRYPYDGTSIPVFSIPPGNYAQEGSVSLELSCDTVGAQMRYTLDGSIPTADHGILYDGNPVTLSSDVFVQAVAYVGEKVSYLHRGYYVFSPPDIYQIDDTGPAGGIVAYDKGDYEDGWRYLEVVPIGLWRAGLRWGLNLPVGTRENIGAGYKNTRLLLDCFGPAGDASLYCWNLSYGGYSDWFLPSCDEIFAVTFIMGNIEGYLKDEYWSSSESSSFPDCVFTVFPTTRDDKHGVINTPKNWTSSPSSTLPMRRF